MIVNNWPVVMEAQIFIGQQYDGSGVARVVAALAFFLVFHVINLYLIMNVLTAFVLDQVGTPG